MVELDAASVLSIPRKLKSQEVVRRGFMSNFLFRNISNVFGAPAIVREIVEKLTPAHEEGKKADTQKLDGMDTVHVDENGEVDLPQEIVIGRTQDLFGPKIYEEIKEDVTEQIAAISTAENTEVHEQLKNIAGTIKSNIKEKILPPAMEEYGVKKGTQSRLERQIEKEIDRTFDEIHDDYAQQEKLARTRLENKRQEAETEEEVQQAETEYQTDMNAAMQIVQVLINIVDNAIKYTPPGSEIAISWKRNGAFIEISVADNGPGISDEAKPHVFDMFYSASNRIADSRRSMGLGLALCKSIVNAHGGEITVTDHLPHGSIFTFSVPAGEVELHE